MPGKTVKSQGSAAGTDGRNAGWKFYLAALGVYVTVWEERDELRKTLLERGEKTHLWLSRQVTDFQKQVRSSLEKRLQ